MTEPVVLLWHLFLQDLFANLDFDTDPLQSAWPLQNSTDIPVERRTFTRIVSGLGLFS
jgi:hypothetical protein